MRYLKIILSLLLVLTMCLGAGIYTVSAADTENEIVSDIELLNMLGIFQGYEDGSLHPDRSITRMQFAALVIRALGYDNGLGQMETQFSDVPADLWGSGYVKMAYDLGIVSGYGDGSFRPENPVTQAEAVKMMVAALGYGEAAERSGGFPQGYIGYASRLQLLENAVSTSSQATRGYVASLIVNALETGILEPVVNGDTMEVTDETILSRMGITVREGTLTAVYGASLTDTDDLEKDEVIVSDQRFKTNLNISTDFIGTKVKIYVQDYGKDDEMVVGITGKYSGKTLTVAGKDIKENTTLNSLEYYDSNKKNRSADLEDGLKITYNGKLIDNSADYTKERIMPENGTVKLMDTNNNGKYDTAIVKDYATYVVRSVSDRAINDEFGKSIRIDADEDIIISVIEDNVYKKVSDIKAGDVLSAAISLDGSVVEILICRETTSGIVTMQEDTEDGLVYYLDNGDALQVSRDYEAALSGGYNMAKKIEIGSDMLFYLNHFGEIAATVINSGAEDDGNYGFVIQMAKGGSGLSNAYELEILTENNRYEVFETSSTGKVSFGRMVNGSYVVSKVAPEEIFNTLYYGGKYISRQLAMYELDSKGAIKEFYLRDETGDTTYFSFDVRRGSKIVSNHLIDGKYYWDDNTVLFHIPLDAQYLTHLSAGKVDDYFSSGSYTLELYDVEENGYVNCIYYYDTGTGRALTEGGSWSRIDYVNSPIMYVTRVYHEYNDEGIEYKIVEGWENKVKVRRLLSDTLSKKATDIKPGSVIQYATNESDQLYADSIDNDVTIVVYTHLFDCDYYGAEEFMLYDYTAHPFANPRIKFGLSTVSRVDYPYIRLAGDDTLAEIHAGTMVYVYNRSTDEFIKGDISDINEGEQVFIRSRYNNLREIVVFED